MKAKDIQELLDFIAKSGLNKVDIETEEFKISVQRDVTPKIKYISEAGGGKGSASAAASAAPQPAAAQQPEAAPAAAPAPADESKLTTIKSPMIGTFYRSTSPDKPLFVNVGDEVMKGQVSCIREAMKLLNEIESEISGRIVKVLVENASPVEYDQPLFLVEPS
ncbi:acetyl-CoA carboxylase biotin carboxyl carrier protein [soil metagenome]